MTLLPLLSSSSRLPVLLKAAEAGLEAISKVSRTELGVAAKGTRDLVTEADKRSQEAILTVLAKECPDLAIVAEEQEEHTISSDTYIAVDPIDGTYDFIFGAPDWGVTVGLVQNGKPHAGAIIIPGRNATIVAEKGVGTFINGRRITLSDSGLPLARHLIGVEMGWFVGKKRLEKELLPLVERALAARGVLSAVSGALEVLSGITGAYVCHHGAKVWDFAAGAIAIEEAGGVVSDAHGSPAKWDEVYLSICYAHSSRLHKEIFP